MSDRLKSIIQQVLLSDSFCNNLQSAIQHVSGTTAVPSSSSTTTARSTPLHGQNENVAAELRKLFPSINSNERSTTNKNRICKKRTKNSTQTFKRTVFLLKSPTCERTLTGIRKRDAFKEGYALVAVNFAKSWTYEDIEAHLREIFCSKLPEYAGFEILIPVSGYLVKPNMPENASLDGENLSTISNQKPIYIRPTVESATSEDDKMVYSDPVSSAISDRDYLCENNEDLTSASGALYDEHYEYYNPYEVNMSSSKDEDYRDTDIETAIKNSLMTIEDILKELCNKIDTEHTTIINIYREDVYNCFIRALKRKNFCPFHKLSVSFTDIDSKIEGAFDAGGPTRELFSLLVQHLHYRSRVFEGPDGSKNLSFCADALDMNEYYYAGLIMAMSVIHGGPSPAFLSPVLYAFLTDGDAKPSLMDIGYW